MAEQMECEPMDQDCEDGGETLQVQVPNDLFGNNNEDILDFEEAEDLEISEFALNKSKGNVKAKEANGTGTAHSADKVAISVTSPGDADKSNKEDGEISETNSQSDESDIADDGKSDGSAQYFSRSSSLRSSRRRNDIRRERSPVARRYPNPYLEFDDEKIQSRALRFGLVNPPAAGGSVIEKPAQISDEDLLNLYISCGLIPDDGGKLTLEKVSSHYRLDSILIRGTNHMNTNEIFKYLYDLSQKPAAMEWVNDAMCVVIYNNQYEAALSLLKMSKPIVMDPGMSERKRSTAQAIENDSTKEKDEIVEEKMDIMSEDFDYSKQDAIPQSWVTVPMPPGSVWRLGTPCDKAKGILIRYATKHDKKQERAERFSEYYRNYGNPNKASSREPTGGEFIRRKKKIRQESVTSQDFERKDTQREPQIKVVSPNDKNGWGQLSAMWDDEEAFQKSARDRFVYAKRNSKDSESSASGVSPMKRQESLREARDPMASKSVDAREILKSRQKRKRGTYSSDEEAGSDRDSGDTEQFGVNDSKDNGSFRKKRNSKIDDDDDGDSMAWRERLSGPRMRMHADEEEERMKRRAFRRLGRKRGGESSLQTNSWDFSRDSSNNSSFRSKPAAQSRRPISERLGAKRVPTKSNDNNESAWDETDDSFQKHNSFDLRHKLINMRRGGKEADEQGEIIDDEEDLQDLIFYKD